MGSQYFSSIGSTPMDTHLKPLVHRKGIFVATLVALYIFLFSPPTFSGASFLRDFIL